MDEPRGVGLCEPGAESARHAGDFERRHGSVHEPLSEARPVDELANQVQPYEVILPHVEECRQARVHHRGHRPSLLAQSVRDRPSHVGGQVEITAEYRKRHLAPERDVTSYKDAQ